MAAEPIEQNHYEILEVPIYASPEQITDAFLRKFVDSSADDADQTRCIAAYRVLMNITLREKYNREHGLIPSADRPWVVMTPSPFDEGQGAASLDRSTATDIEIKLLQLIKEFKLYDDAHLIHTAYFFSAVEKRRHELDANAQKTLEDAYLFWIAKIVSASNSKTTDDLKILFLYNLCRKIFEVGTPWSEFAWRMAKALDETQVLPRLLFYQKAVHGIIDSRFDIFMAFALYSRWLHEKRLFAEFWGGFDGVFILRWLAAESFKGFDYHS